MSERDVPCFKRDTGVKRQRRFIPVPARLGSSPNQSRRIPFPETPSATEDRLLIDSLSENGHSPRTTCMRFLADRNAMRRMQRGAEFWGHHRMVRHDDQLDMLGNRTYMTEIGQGIAGELQDDDEGSIIRMRKMLTARDTDQQQAQALRKPCAQHANPRSQGQSKYLEDDAQQYKEMYDDDPLLQMSSLQEEFVDWDEEEMDTDMKLSQHNRYYGN